MALNIYQYYQFEKQDAFLFFIGLLRECIQLYLQPQYTLLSES